MGSVRLFKVNVQYFWSAFARFCYCSCVAMRDTLFASPRFVHANGDVSQHIFWMCVHASVTEMNSKLTLASNDTHANGMWRVTDSCILQYDNNANEDGVYDHRLGKIQKTCAEQAFTMHSLKHLVFSRKPRVHCACPHMLACLRACAHLRAHWQHFPGVDWICNAMLPPFVYGRGANPTNEGERMIVACTTICQRMPSFLRGCPCVLA